MQGTEDKPIKHIEVTIDEWDAIKQKIVDEYGRSTAMISWATKARLGFTPRNHTRWCDDGRFRQTVCLDFYDEAMKTWFILKYL